MKIDISEPPEFVNPWIIPVIAKKSFLIIWLFIKIKKFLDLEIIIVVIITADTK